MYIWEQLIYEGHFLKGVKHGRGINYFGDRCSERDEKGLIVYDGQLEDKRRHGVGREYGSDGKVVYDGEWFQGFRLHGKEYLGDWYYEGPFENNARHGKGTFVNPKTGETICGDFAEGELLWGRSSLNGVVVYEGQFCKEWRNGFGRELRPDGSVVYEGQYYRNHRHGHGSLHDVENRVVFVGKWEIGCRSGMGIDYNPFTNQPQRKQQWLMDAPARVVEEYHPFGESC